VISSLGVTESFAVKLDNTHIISSLRGQYSANREGSKLKNNSATGSSRGISSGIILLRGISSLIFSISYTLFYSIKETLLLLTLLKASSLYLSYSLLIASGLRII